MSDIISTADDVHRAQAQHHHIKALRNGIEATFLELAARLYEFRADHDYLHLGYDTFEEYIADPDVDISRTVAYRLLGIHETFVLGWQVPPVGLLEAGTTKLDMVRVVVTPETVEEWVSKAAALSKSDLQLEIDALRPKRRPRDGVLFRERGFFPTVIKAAYEAMPDWGEGPVEVTISRTTRKDGDE